MVSVGSDEDFGATSYISLIEMHERSEAFTEMTGITGDDLVLSRFVNTPIPLYPSEWPAQRNRWLGVRASAMTSPLMWLHDELACRYVDPDDGTLESDDAWALRVVFELEQRGLFDPETGEWEDVLWANGFDIDDPDVEFRVEQWLAGADDAELDSIRLPDVHPSELTAEQDWSIIAAASFIEAAAPLMAVLDCITLRSDLEALVSEASSVQGLSPSLATALCGLCEMAADCFVGIGTERDWWLAADAEIRRLDRIGGTEAVRSAIVMLSVRLDQIESQLRSSGPM